MLTYNPLHKEPVIGWEQIGATSHPVPERILAAKKLWDARGALADRTLDEFGHIPHSVAAELERMADEVERMERGE